MEIKKINKNKKQRNRSNDRKNTVPKIKRKLRNKMKSNRIKRRHQKISKERDQDKIDNLRGPDKEMTISIDHDKKNQKNEDLLSYVFK